MRKKFTVSLLILALGLLLAATAYGANGIDIPQVTPDSYYVYDQGKVLKQSTVDELNRMLISLEASTSAEVAVVSVKSLNGYDVSEYGVQVAHGMGIGKADKDNGILLLFSKPDHHATIQVGKGLEGTLTDAECGRILREDFKPDMDKGDYDQATLKTIQAIVDVVQKEYSTPAATTGTEANATDDPLSILPCVGIFIVIIAIAGIMFFMVMKDDTPVMSGPDDEYDDEDDTPIRVSHKNKRATSSIITPVIIPAVLPGSGASEPDSDDEGGTIVHYDDDDDDDSSSGSFGSFGGFGDFGGGSDDSFGGFGGGDFGGGGASI